MTKVRRNKVLHISATICFELLRWFFQFISEKKLRQTETIKILMKPKKIIWMLDMAEFVNWPLLPWFLGFIVVQLLAVEVRTRFKMMKRFLSYLLLKDYWCALLQTQSHINNFVHELINFFLQEVINSTMSCTSLIFFVTNTPVSVQKKTIWSQKDMLHFKNLQPVTKYLAKS